MQSIILFFKNLFFKKPIRNSTVRANEHHPYRTSNFISFKEQAREQKFNFESFKVNVSKLSNLKIVKFVAINALRFVLGLLIVSLVVSLVAASIWLLFSGVAKLGCYLNDHIYHFNDKYGTNDQFLDDWAIGFTTLLLFLVSFVVGEKVFEELGLHKKFNINK